MLVEDQYLNRVQNDEKFQWRNQSLLLPESQVMESAPREKEIEPTYAHLY